MSKKRNNNEENDQWKNYCVHSAIQNVVSFFECIKPKPKLNERMINYNFALTKVRFDQLFKKQNIIGFFHYYSR